MKRGIRFVPNVVGTTTDPPPAEIFGIPIVYARDSRHPIADARGFGKKAHIVVGPLWHKLDHRSQLAVLCHEAGHIKGKHREERMLMLAILAIPAVVLLPWQVLACLAATMVMYFGVERIAQNQELAADRFAAQQGYGLELLNIVRAAGPPATAPFFYPPFERRVGALARFLEESRK